MGVSCGDRIIVRVTFRVRFRVGLCVRVRVRDRKLSLGTYYVCLDLWLRTRVDLDTGLKLRNGKVSCYS